MRRSARVRELDPILYPGHGTRKDLLKLTEALNEGNTANPLTVDQVEEIMKSRGRRGALDEPEETPVAAHPNAWADFMQEEGVEVEGQAEISPSKVKAHRVYKLPDETAKKTKVSANNVLVQAGTLDCSMYGRSKLNKDDKSPWHLTVPTRILDAPVKIAKVFAACNACHSILIDDEGKPYGWGRNELCQLTDKLPMDVVSPTPLPGVKQAVQQVAMGKSHTVLLLKDGSLMAVGSNKVGQCGLSKHHPDVITSFVACKVQDLEGEDDVVFQQIACGDDFSVALDAQGRIFSTGSSEYGQLGNGETGEYFIQANKLAFANCYEFTLRTIFCHAPGESSHKPTDKVELLNEDIRLQSIACGRHHTIGIEAESEGHRCRIFSWGSGDYGCLGHGVQKPEYYPRLIASFKHLHLPVGDLEAAAGAHCSMVRTSAGHVYYWGKHRSVGEATMRPSLNDVLANNQHVVTHAKAGAQSVVCCTDANVVVAWGQSPTCELGLGSLRSSAQPKFVEALDGCHVSDVACGYGHTVYLVRNEKEDKARVAKLGSVDEKAVKPLQNRLSRVHELKI